MTRRDPEGALVTAGWAADHDLGIGDELLLTGARPETPPLTIIGLLSDTGVGALSGGSVVVLAMDTLNGAFEIPSPVTAMDLAVGEGREAEVESGLDRVMAEPFVVETVADAEDGLRARAVGLCRHRVPAGLGRARSRRVPCRQHAGHDAVGADPRDRSPASRGHDRPTGARAGRAPGPGHRAGRLAAGAAVGAGDRRDPGLGRLQLAHGAGDRYHPEPGGHGLGPVPGRGGDAAGRVGAGRRGRAGLAPGSASPGPLDAARSVEPAALDRACRAGGGDRGIPAVPAGAGDAAAAGHVAGGGSAGRRRGGHRVRPRAAGSNRGCAVRALLRRHRAAGPRQPGP